MYTLEAAQLWEAEVCSSIIDDARKFQREQGFVQWTDDYPDRETIQKDIRDKKGYVMRAGGVIAGYMCIDFSGEPAYRDIKGAWGSGGPYAVVHRMAFDRTYRGIGAADAAFRLIEDFCLQHGIRNIRVDTDPLNKRMQHILRKNNFEYRGTILFQGGERAAFDRAL